MVHLLFCNINWIKTRLKKDKIENTIYKHQNTNKQKLILVHWWVHVLWCVQLVLWWSKFGVCLCLMATCSDTILCFLFVLQVANLREQKINELEGKLVCVAQECVMYVGIYSFIFFVGYAQILFCVDFSAEYVHIQYVLKLKCALFLRILCAFFFAFF